MNYDKILNLASHFLKMTKYAENMQMTGNQLWDAGNALFEAGLWPTQKYPKGQEHIQMDLNHPVMTNYVWPAVDAAAGGVPAEIIIHYSPEGVSFTSKPPAVAQHPKIQELAKKATMVLKNKGIAVTDTTVFGTGLQ